MTLIVTVERRYLKYNSEYYLEGVEDYSFFNRYLTVFDTVYVLARCSEVERIKPSYCKFNAGPNVFILPIETKGTGALSILNIFFTLSKKHIQDSHIILRTPGTLAYLVYFASTFFRYQFSLEIVTDPEQEANSITPYKIINSFYSKFFHWVFIRQLKNCKAASFVTTHQLQDKYLTDKQRPLKKFSFSYSSLDLPLNHFITEAELTHKLSNFSTNDNITITFIGDLNRPFKGLDVLLKAMTLLDTKYKLQIIGDGKLMKHYQSLTHQLLVQDRVFFIGYIKDTDLKFRLLKSSHLLVLPSRREGLPRVLIEAMASGLPCIATRVSGVLELIEDKFVVSVDDYKAISCKINLLMQNPEAYKEASFRNLYFSYKYEKTSMQLLRDDYYQYCLSK
jgi:glycosyltransferase involved in cell wall biosynthesis